MGCWVVGLVGRCFSSVPGLSILLKTNCCTHQKDSCCPSSPELRMAELREFREHGLKKRWSSANFNFNFNEDHKDERSPMSAVEEAER